MNQFEINLKKQRSKKQRIAVMKPLTLLVLFCGLLLTSCGDDDNVSCVRCSNDVTLDFTLCREANGDASVNGQDTDTDYDVYLANLNQEGTSCN